MLKEAWDSLKDNIKERITNPFLGTFVLVWVVHNWKVVYAFFFFDKEWKLQPKIDYFNKYWGENNFFWNLIVSALLTLGILVLTYCFLAIAKYLSKIFENIVIPFISKITKGKIVTLEIYQSALDKIIFLEAKVDIERKAKSEAIDEVEELTKRLYSPNRVIDGGEISDETKDAKQEKDTASGYLSFKPLIEKSDTLFKSKDMESTLTELDKSSPFDDEDPVIDFLLRHDLIELTKKSLGLKLIIVTLQMENSSEGNSLTPYCYNNSRRG